MRAAACPDADPIASATCGAPECPCGRCDGLPDKRDPWPTSCNRALFSEPFCDSTLWNSAYYGTHSRVQHPGSLTFHIEDANFGVTAWVGPQANLKIQPADLAEVRIKPQSLAWLFRLGVASTMPVNNGLNPPPEAWSRRSCKLERGAGQEPVLSSTSGESAESESFSSLTPELVLQSWVAGGYHHCRLFGHNGTLLANVAVKPVASETGVTAMIAVLSDETSAPATVEVDYLRIFKAP